MKYVAVLALLLTALSCGPPGPPAASPVHEWLSVHADGWFSSANLDVDWSSGGGMSGGGTGGLGGGGMRFTSHSRIQGRVPEEERGAMMAGFRAEIDRQITANGGDIGGRSLSGTEEAPEGFGFGYEAENGALGGVFVEAVNAEDGWFVVLLASFEVR